MSYAASAALQKAVFQTLAADAALAALVGDAIYDAVPGGQVPGLYLSLGTEEVLVRGDVSASIARHRVTVSVIADSAGFGPAKTAAGLVSAVLNGATPVLDTGVLISMRLDRTRALRVGRNKKRRIDLRFEALVDTQ